MAKQNWQEQFLIEKGYTKGADGVWNPPALKSKYIQSLKEGEPVVEKQIVKTTPDFVFKGITTEWFIPYQIPSKKNSRQVFVSKNGKMVNIPSKAYTEYIQVTKNYWITFGKEFKKSIEVLGLKYPLNIEMTFTRKTNQVLDYFGPGESVFDLMTDFEWWTDDNTRCGKPFFGDIIVDKNNPGTRIKILTK
jgi:hypothetical protein